MRVHWSNKAVAQLNDIAEGIRLYSEAAAERLENDLITASRKLMDFPELGRVVPESNVHALRELFVGKHRLIYTVGDFQIEIVAVVHQAQAR